MTIIIDNNVCECTPGEYVLDVAKRNGLTIPSLCRHPAIEPDGCCRLCIVEIFDKKKSFIAISCAYPIEGEIEVRTDTERVKRQREITLAFLHKRAPGSEVIKNMCSQYSVPEFDRLKTENEPSKCILCGLCARVCSELGTGAITTVGRGADKTVDTPYKEPSAACIGCASCANVCPTEAIAVTDTEKTREIWHRMFEFEYCESCGAASYTKEAIAWAEKLSGAKQDGLCAECRKQAAAKQVMNYL